MYLNESMSSSSIYLYSYYSTYLIKQQPQQNDQMHYKSSQGC